MKYIEKKKSDKIAEFMLLVDTDEMLKMFLEHGLINKITDKYGDDLESMCNNAVTYVLAKMAEQNGTEVLNTLNVSTGFYGGWDHTWITLGDIIIDPSLAQFDLNAPRIAFIDKYESEHKASQVSSARRWLENVSGGEIPSIETGPMGDDQINQMVNDSDLSSDDLGYSEYQEESCEGLAFFTMILRSKERDLEEEWVKANESDRVSIDETLIQYDMAITAAENILAMREYDELVFGERD